MRLTPKATVMVFAAKDQAQDDLFLGECFYRLAMHLEGYPGALTTSSFGEHRDSAYFIGKRDYVGSIVSPDIQHLIRRCPNVISSYYQEQFPSVETSQCVRELLEN